MMIDPAQVANLLGRDETDAGCVFAVELVSEQIRSYTGTSVTGASAVHGFEGTWSTRLQLGERPIDAVASVVLDGVLLSETDYRWTRRGAFHRRAGWGGPAAEVVISYTFGYRGIPSDLRAVCLSASARTAANPLQLGSEGTSSSSSASGEDGSSQSTDNSSRSYAAGFTLGERIILDRHRRSTYS